MTHAEDSVVERNVRRLLERAYRPARADGGFLRQLRGQVLEAVALRAAAGAATSAVTSGRRWGLAVAAAALLVAAAVGVRLGIAPPSSAGGGSVADRSTRTAGVNAATDSAVADAQRVHAEGVGEPLARDNDGSASERRAVDASRHVPVEDAARAEALRRAADREAAMGNIAIGNTALGNIANDEASNSETGATAGAPTDVASAKDNMFRVEIELRLSTAEGETPDVAELPAQLEVAVLEQRSWPEVVKPRHMALEVKPRPPLGAQPPSPVGRASIELPRARHQVFARSPGGAALGPFDVDGRNGDVVRIELVICAPRTVRGRVENANGEPVMGAVVVVESAVPPRVLALDSALWPEHHADFAPSARTGSDGRFELHAVGPGPVVLRANAPGHGPTWLAPTDTAAVLTLPVAAAVRGQAGAPEGGPWVGATVVATHLGDPGGTGRASYALGRVDDFGRYSLEGLAAGNHVVLLFAPRLPGAPEGSDSEVRAMRYIDIAAGASLDIDFQLGSPRARLGGSVARRDGTPVVGLSVGLWRDDPIATGPVPGRWIATVTDADGEFSFADLDAGPWVLFASTDMERSMSAVAWPDLSAAADTRLQVVLPTGSIRIPPIPLPASPVDRDTTGGNGPEASTQNTAIAVVLFRVTTSGERPFAGRAGALRLAAIEIGPLPPGTYDVEVHTADGVFAIARADVAEGVVEVQLRSPTEPRPR